MIPNIFIECDYVARHLIISNYFKIMWIASNILMLPVIFAIIYSISAKNTQVLCYTHKQVIYIFCFYPNFFQVTLKSYHPINILLRAIFSIFFNISELIIHNNGNEYHPIVSSQNKIKRNRFSYIFLHSPCIIGTDLWFLHARNYWYLCECVLFLRKKKKRG